MQTIRLHVDDLSRALAYFDVLAMDKKRDLNPDGPLHEISALRRR
jgi:hypothetical protein